MKERPILFNGEMVRAILDGGKTQTRRVVKPQPVVEFYKANGTSQERVSEEVYRTAPGWPDDRFHIFRKTPEARGAMSPLWAELNCPYGQPGDRLWVRETFCHVTDANDYNKKSVLYRASHNTDAYAGCWKPSIHMPRWASRITLEITAVRVERLQDISEADAVAEGCTGTSLGPHVSADELETARDHFRRLWDSIYGNLEQNPWVWVVEFRKLTI